MAALLKFHICLGANQTKEKKSYCQELRTMKISVREVVFNYLLPRQACKTNLITCSRQAADLHLKSCVHRVTCGSGLRLKVGKKEKGPSFLLHVTKEQLCSVPSLGKQMHLLPGTQS